MMDWKDRYPVLVADATRKEVLGEPLTEDEATALAQYRAEGN